MSTQYLLDITIVCFNCGSDIVNVIDDLKKGSLPFEQIKLIIVDNNSSDNSVALLKAHASNNVVLIESPNNAGFGTGCNQAIPHLSAPKTLFLNPDVRLHKTSIAALLSFSDSCPDAKIWGGVTTDTNGKADGKCAWKEPSLSGVLCWSFFIDILLKFVGIAPPDAYSEATLQTDHQVDAVSGSFFLIDTQLLVKLQGFDERFFMYSEEVDLCRRARDMGAKPRSTPNATIIHEGSKTITSINKLDFLYHSKLLYGQKYWSHSAFKIAKGAILTGSILRYLIFVCLGLISTRFKKTAALWKTFIGKQAKWKF